MTTFDNYIIMGKNANGTPIAIGLVDASQAIGGYELYSLAVDSVVTINPGDITIGTVDQGTAGADPWLIAGNVGRIATQVAPVDQASTASFVSIAGSSLDTLHTLTVSYTIVNDGLQSIDWQVLGANASDFSDAQVVSAPATILAAGVSGYSATQAVWRYYIVQIKDTVGGVHGAALVRGITKG